ncbi:MAG: AMP-binding protein, partial [Elusimicrobiota bacterium]|nr:AMP-binding protein [Elusimicrobiota bacterium]
PDAPAETQAAAAAERFDLAAPRAAAGLAVPADAPAPGTPEPSGLAPARGAVAPAPRARPLPEVVNERPFLLRHYAAVKALVSPLLKLVYPVAVADAARVPATGPVILVANHAGYIDPLLLAYAAGRPVRFMMFRGIYETPGFKWLFRSFGAIPVAAGESREAVDAALAAARAALRDGEVVVIFPEGKLTHTGGLDKFKRGFETLARETGAPVVPAHIDGVWGSLFSRREDPRSLPARVLAEVRRPTAVRFGAPLPSADAATARQAVLELGAEAMEARVRRRGRTLGREFFASAKRRWSRPALSDRGGARRTYGEALADALLLGAELERRLGAGARVGVRLPATVDGALARLALTLSGRVPVELDPSAPAEDLAHAAATAGFEAMLVSRRLEGGVGVLAPPPAGERLVFVEDALAAVPGWKRASLRALLRLLPRALAEALFARRAARGLDETAAVLFTAGSGARPKGVELSHLSLRAGSEMAREAFAFRADDAVLGVLPLHQAYALNMTLWTPLLKGLRVAFHDDPYAHASVGDWARDAGATVLPATPSLLRRYRLGVPADRFRRLRLVTTAGERLPGDLAAEFEKRFGVRPLEGYGATELAGLAAAGVPDRLKQKGWQEGAVGLPLPGQALRVADPVTLAPLPPGVEGVLLAKGPNSFKGYLGGAAPAAATRDGWYITGDLATMSREGFVRVTGRSASFSKVGGVSVSHAAVAERLRRAAPGGRFAVTGVPDARRGERLVVLYEGWDGDPAALRAALRRGVPHSWIPDAASFHRVDALPRLTGERLDAEALRARALELEAGRP